MPDAIAAAVGTGQVIDALQYDFGSGQVVAVGASAASSAAFTRPYTAATITATTNCWYSIGATAVAHGAASEYLPAGLKIKVKFAPGQTISVIQDTLAGFLSITPASNPNISPLLLDTVPAAAAYSLRLLNSAYLGACINVRRSSDNSTTNIGFTASGDLDVATMNTFIGAGSGFVATWYDQSGNGNNVVQATAATQPQIISNSAVFKGRPGAVFAGAQILSVASPVNAPTSAASRTLISVAAVTTFTKYIIGMGTAAAVQDFTQFLIAGTTNLQAEWFSASVDSGLPGGTGANILVTSYDGTRAYTQLNSTRGNSAAVALNTVYGTISIGGFLNATYYVTGQVGEAIFYSQEMINAGTVMPVVANQRAYWGTP